MYKDYFLIFVVLNGIFVQIVKWRIIYGLLYSTTVLHIYIYYIHADYKFSGE